MRSLTGNDYTYSECVTRGLGGGGAALVDSNARSKQQKEEWTLLLTAKMTDCLKVGCSYDPRLGFFWQFPTLLIIADALLDVL